MLNIDRISSSWKGISYWPFIRRIVFIPSGRKSQTISSLNTMCVGPCFVFHAQAPLLWQCLFSTSNLIGNWILYCPEHLKWLQGKPVTSLRWQADNYSFVVALLSSMKKVDLKKFNGNIKKVKEGHYNTIIILPIRW